MSRDTSQKERLPDALHPASFKIDDRSLSNLYTEAQALAEAMAFYEEVDATTNKSWAPFFAEAEAYIQEVSAGEPGSELSQRFEAGQCPAHLALFLAFLKLFRHTQSQLNKLTSSHLHFFFHKVLKQEKKKAEPDKAFVFFELARLVKNYFLPRGESLLAGKDATGNSMVYTTDRDVALNQAKVVRFMAIHNQKASDGSIYAYPVANSSNGLGKPLEERQGWYPFGNPRLSRLSAAIGLGIGSPMFYLNEGLRTVQIAFTLINGSNHAAALKALEPSLFEMHLTGPDAWFIKEISEITFEDKKLTFVARLSEVDHPVVAFDKNVHKDPVGQMYWPMIKIVLKQGFSYNDYAFFQALRFTRISLKVEVEKAHGVQVRNDFGDMNAGRAFLPFGYTPVTGSNFYIGLEEIYQKPITRISVKIKWTGLPESFRIYYEGYIGSTNSPVTTRDDFKIKAAILYQKEWLPIRNKPEDSKEFPLFSETLFFETEDYPKKVTNPDLKANGEDGLIRLTLSSPDHAFGHILYPTVYARAIMSQLQNKEYPIPNQPYTPVVESISLAYAAEEEIDLSKVSDRLFNFYYINPFGIEEVFPRKGEAHEIKARTYPLLSDELHHAGSLYVGIENLQPPQQLAIFFEIEEEIILDKPEPIFVYLSETGWQYLSESQVLSDTTLGLKQTGILSLNLPSDLTFENLRMPAGSYWIRISVPDHPESFDKILHVRTNAVSCSRSLEQASATLAEQVLPPFSIKNLSRKVIEIKKIEQPYSSFSGQPAEEEVHYYTRVSEKLRHKMRGISSWDVERIILEQFPEIFKVKCIPHHHASGKLEPGSLHIIVIPVIKKHSQKKILKPKVPYNTLIEITKFTERLVSPFAQIKVANPSYEELKVIAQVNFMTQTDAGFYLTELQKDLQYFLSPWAFQDDHEIQLGNTLYQSSIINYIESRPYVNFIAGIRFLKDDNEIKDQELNPDPQSVIVSADFHDLKAVESTKIVCQTNEGIEQMIVDINFVVQEAI